MSCVPPLDKNHVDTPVSATRCHDMDTPLVSLSALRLHLYPLGDEGLVMWITHRDAIVMYAKFYRAHYGFNAHQRVKTRARELAQRGDFDGEKIWNEVAAELENASQRSTAYA